MVLYLNVILEQPKRLMFALNVMAIRDLRHANKSKQTASLAGFDIALSIGVASRSHDLHVFHREMKNIKKYLYLGRLQ